MTEVDYKVRIEALSAELHRHLHAYHVQDAPTIPDAEYDKLFLELQQLELDHPELIASDSPTRRVGAAPLPQFDQVTHSVPMLSLNNGFTDEDIENFDRRVRDGLDTSAAVEYAAEVKYDGLAINLRYENGILMQAKWEDTACMDSEPTPTPASAASKRIPARASNTATCSRPFLLLVGIGLGIDFGQQAFGRLPLGRRGLGMRPGAAGARLGGYRHRVAWRRRWWHPRGRELFLLSRCQCLVCHLGCSALKHVTR